ncbi:MAG: hypothetical protein WAK95_21705 [Desulfobacterales bacterium]
MNKLALVVVTGLIALAVSVDAADKQTPAPDLAALTDQEAEAFYLGLNAVIWGYPAVKFEQLMRGRTRPRTSSSWAIPRRL